MQGHRDLLVWQKAMDLVAGIYRLTRAFPREEVYGLTSQIRRAAVSVPSNIAEGHALKQTLAYRRHLAIASGSRAELQTPLDIAARLGYIKAENMGISSQVDEVGRMLAGLRKSLGASLSSADPRFRAEP